MKGPHNFEWNRPFDDAMEQSRDQTIFKGTGLVPLSGADEMIPVFRRDYTFSMYDGKT